MILIDADMLLNEVREITKHKVNMEDTVCLKFLVIDAIRTAPTVDVPDIEYMATRISMIKDTMIAAGYSTDMIVDYIIDIVKGDV